MECSSHFVFPSSLSIQKSEDKNKRLNCNLKQEAGIQLYSKNVSEYHIDSKLECTFYVTENKPILYYKSSRLMMYRERNAIYANFVVT
jgi:hypothetical protein